MIVVYNQDEIRSPQWKLDQSKEIFFGRDIFAKTMSIKKDSLGNKSKI